MTYLIGVFVIVVLTAVQYLVVMPCAFLILILMMAFAKDKTAAGVWFGTTFKNYFLKPWADGVLT